MENLDLNLEAVLEKELYTTPPLIPVIVAKIIGSNKEIPRVFRLTKDLCSTADLKHLRRVRDLPEDRIECIICRVHSTEKSELNDKLKSVQHQFASECVFEDYRITHVPGSAPRTDHQFKACAKIWPCKFAKSNYLIQCIEGSVFNEAEKLVLRTIVDDLLRHIRQNDNNTRAGAVVFRCAKIYGVGLSSPEVISQNPTKHSAMISIDSVATNAGAGHWRCQESDLLLKSIQGKLDDERELDKHRIDVQFLPYLCTNYDIFVTEEPCFMCTMGLVQSRIRRLFYLDAMSIKKFTDCQQLCYPDRAIEEFLVHRDKNLNHRFEAWRITLVPSSREVIE